MQFIFNLVKQFNHHKIDYAIAGGWAVALHQIPRATFDVDLVIHLSESNFERVESVLNQMGLVSKLPVNAKDIFKFRKEYIQNRNLIAWSFSNPLNPSDIVDIILTEDKKKLDTIIKTIGDIKIPVLSAQSLITMKLKANRPQDIEDIKWLKKLI